MEYRVRYRDIPWSVALGVLPGKIIGTFIIKPFKRFERNKFKAMIKLCYVLLIFVIALIVLVGLNTVLEGTLFQWIGHLKDVVIGWLAYGEAGV